MSSVAGSMNPLHRFWGLIYIYVKERIQFRFAFFMTIFTTLLYAVMYYLVWKAVYQNSSTFPMEWQELITYVMVGQAVNMARLSPAERRPLLTMGFRIRNGDVALDLLRPINLQGQRFVESFSYFLTEIIWVNIPVILLMIFALGISLPPTLGAALAFPLSILIGFFIGFAFNMVILTLAFWTRNVFGAQIAKRAVVDIFAGTLIPFQLFPQWLQVVVEHLPFKGMAYIPLSIWTGAISGRAIPLALLEQLAWAGLMYVIALFIWRKAMRIIIIHGG
ncbi:MAG: ABC-2 family transporter protein [Spirochaetales bacterium]|nr:ABC-2 family transporter protein [Spirochaetales bacterium]